MSNTRDYNDWMHERLQDVSESAAYLRALTDEDGFDEHAFLLAVKQVAQAQGLCDGQTQ